MNSACGAPNTSRHIEANYGLSYRRRAHGVAVSKPPSRNRQNASADENSHRMTSQIRGFQATHASTIAFTRQNRLLFFRFRFRAVAYGELAMYRVGHWI